MNGGFRLGVRMAIILLISQSCELERSIYKGSRLFDNINVHCPDGGTVGNCVEHTFPCASVSRCFDSRIVGIAEVHTLGDCISASGRSAGVGDVVRVGLKRSIHGFGCVTFGDGGRVLS